MLLEYDGVKFSQLDQENMTLGEIAAVERATGLRQAQIRAMAQICGCEHPLRGHVVKDGEELAKCAQCGCADPSEDLPIDVMTAFLWVSMRRSRPEITFSDVEAIAMSEIRVVEEGPDPSTGGQPQEDETTSEPADSPTSESSPNS